MHRPECKDSIPPYRLHRALVERLVLDEGAVHLKKSLQTLGYG
jgi:hypothetical protein